MRKYALNLVTMIALALAVALFMPQRAAADDDDPPARVARLSYTHGAVSFQPAGTEDWVSAVVNRPLTTGDKLWVDNDARAEVHLGSASIRLSSTTGFSFLNLSDNAVQLSLTEGTLRIRVRRLGDNETFEVDTPNLAFSVLRPGTYKISVNEGGDTTVITVLSGEGEATGGGQAFTVRPDEVGTFTGTDQLNGDIESYGGDEDDFDHWCSGRDRHEDHSQSARYVSSDAVGSEDLDDYGGWRPVPEYGTVWFPHTTVVGWAPYRYGHWVWISPWGWTWVDDEPWGFAPFHYGRWVVVSGVWGWVPCAPAPVVVGVAYVRPVYAPALVAWVGGAHWGVGVAVGSGVAWFPLGPREVYVPSYPVSRTYVNNVNVTNTTVNNTVVNNYYNNVVVNKSVNVNNVNNVTYVNQNVPGAVTATSHAAFTSAQPVAKNMVKVDAKEIASAPVNATTPAVVPQQRSVLGAGATTTVKPPAALQSRAVVAKNTPPPPPPSFAKQHEAIQANGGKPLAASHVRQLQPERAQASVAPVKIAPPAKPAPPQNVQANNGNQAKNTSGNRPPTPNTANQPSQGNKPGATVTPVRQKSFNDRPPSARAATNQSTVNPQLEQKHQQEVQNLHQKQDQERQKIEQQQVQQRQKLAQKNADEQKQAQLDQKHQQQLVHLEQKHDQEQQKLQQKHQQEEIKQKPQQPSKPPKQDRPTHH